MTSPTTRPPAIRARGVVKNFGGTRALDGLNLEVSAGSIHGLLGPNGAGKSTAVGVLATLLIPDAGTAEVAGVDVRRGREVRRHVGLVGQYPAVDEILGGRQNLVMFGRLSGLRKAAAQHRAEEILHTFDLAEAAERPVATYSGGMRRRLDIAAGLILEPDILFLDEPTTGLDPRGRIDVWDLITGIAARGTTVLLATQHLEEADQLVDRISIMKAGRIISEDTPDALKQQHGGARVEITVPRDLDRLPGSFVVTDAEAGVVTYPAPDGARDLIEAVRLLDAAGITPEDISLRRPTLDEVFLTLTEKEEV